MVLTEPKTRAAALVPVARAIVTFEAVVALVGGLGYFVYELTRPGGLEQPVLSIIRCIGLVALGAALFRTINVLTDQPARNGSDRLTLAAAAVANLVFFAPLVWFTVMDPVDAQSNILVLVIAGFGLTTAWVLSTAARMVPDDPT